MGRTMSDSDKSAPYYMPNRNYSKGQVIFNEGDKPDGVYLVVEGGVEIIKKVDGEERHLTTVFKDGVFGEMALINNMPRSASARATENTWCFFIPSHNFSHRLDQLDPFFKGLFKALASNLMAMNNKL